MTAHDTALKFAVLKVLTSQLSDAKKAADCEIRDTWKPKDRNAAVLNGTEIGSVTLSSGRSTSRIDDEDSFLEWVLANHPEEIEQIQITRVNPAFAERLLSQARQIGVALDPTTGETVPGITVSTGDPFPSTRLNDDAAALVAEAWQDGSLAELINSIVRPAIESGEAEAA